MSTNLLLDSIEITESAQNYLAELLAKQNCEGIAVRIFVADPGTPMAETCITYCRPADQKADDDIKSYSQFKLFVEPRSLKFLEDAKIDYATDRMGGQLTIRAPNSRVPKVTEDSPLEDKVNYILHSEVNPSLAAHGGMVSLVEIVDNIAILQFGGGCQGCGMVDMTLKGGVEKTLLEKIPELKGAKDITDHSDTSHAYM